MIAWRRKHPRGDGIRRSTIKALRCIELCSAVRADALRAECIERLAAFSAAPEFAQRRCCATRWAGKTFTARHFGDARQSPGLFEAAPAIHRDERRYQAQPNGL